MAGNLYIIDVIPLVLLPRNQEQILSYFYFEPLPAGSVVEINIRNRPIMAVVVGFDTLKSRKLIYKKDVDFELKNISKIIHANPQVSEQQLKIANYISRYYYAPLGLSLRTILPPFWGRKKYPIVLPTNSKAKQKFILIPEKILTEYYCQKYQTDVFISGEIKNKDYFAIWKKVAGGEATVIVGTRVGLFLSFSNLTEIIVEDESNEAYKSDMTPRYHAVDLAGFIAKLNNARITYHAPAPRLETYHQNLSLFSARYPFSASSKIVNMIDEIKAANFSIFSRDLKDELLKIEKLKLKIILYIPRRGHANFILCQNCHQIVVCPNCNVSLVVHKSVLLCHHCQYSQAIPKSCPQCNYRSLKPFGIGIEKVCDELKKYYQYNNLKLPKIYQLDSDSVKDENVEKEIIGDFLNGDSGILVATQLIFSSYQLISDSILNNLPNKLITGIINADSLINIPDFRADEALFRQIYLLGLISQQLIIQTHNPEQAVIKLAATGQLHEFYLSELANREDFDYPPFAKFIKLSYRHSSNDKAYREAFILRQKLTQAIGPNPAFISKEKGKYVWNIILKIKPSDNKNALLNLVPPGWTIDVDPKNII